MKKFILLSIALGALACSGCTSTFRQKCGMKFPWDSYDVPSYRHPIADLCADGI